MITYILSNDCCFLCTIICAQWLYSEYFQQVVDFGCAELSLLPYLKNMVGVEEIFFVDVDRQILECNRMKAAPLTTDYLQQRQTQLKIEICEGSVIHSDKKLKNTDAVICIELYVKLYEYYVIKTFSSFISFYQNARVSCFI